MEEEVKDIFENLHIGQKVVTKDGIVGIFIGRIDEEDSWYAYQVVFDMGEGKVEIVPFSIDGTNECSNPGWWIVGSYAENVDNLPDIKEEGYLYFWSRNKQNVEPGSETYSPKDIKDAIEYGYRAAQKTK